MITFLQLKSKFAKLFDKTASLLKSTEYFSSQQNSTKTHRKYSNPTTDEIVSQLVIVKCQ